MHDYKIYYLSCPKTYEVRYVGVTVGAISRRLSQHYYETKIRKGSHKLNWISSLQKENLKPNCCIVEHCTKDNWEEREKYHISLFSNLTNTSEGGLGVAVDRSTTSVQRSANAKKIPIVQLTKEGEFIKEWPSAADAKKELGFKTVTSISNVLKRGSNLGHGFRWMYLNDYYSKGTEKRISASEIAIRNSEKISREIQVYDLNGNLLHEFRSANECAKTLGGFASGVLRRLNTDKIFREKYLVKTSSLRVYNRYTYEVVEDGIKFSTIKELSLHVGKSSITISRAFSKSNLIEVNFKTIKRY